MDDVGFWRTALGEELTEQVAVHLSPTVARVIRRDLSFDVADIEVTHTVMAMITAQPGPKTGLLASDDPWAYLYRCAERWMRAEAGHRASGLDAVYEIAAPDTLHEGIDPSHGLTLLPEVVRLTMRVLTPLVQRNRDELAKAVAWFAENPEPHQGHGLSEAQRDPFLTKTLGLNPKQIAAIANITWGPRPQRQTGSLFVGFLLDPAWNPVDSASHRRALAKFRVEFDKPAREPA